MLLHCHCENMAPLCCTTVTSSKYYKLGKRLSFLKHVQSQLLTQTNDYAKNRSSCVKILGEFLDKLDLQYSDGNQHIDEANGQERLSFYENELLQESLKINTELLLSFNKKN